MVRDLAIKYTIDSGFDSNYFVNKKKPNLAID
jgi:hypothetical protein